MVENFASIWVDASGSGDAFMFSQKTAEIPASRPVRLWTAPGSHSKPRWLTHQAKRFQLRRPASPSFSYSLYVPLVVGLVAKLCILGPAPRQSRIGQKFRKKRKKKFLVRML
jgi:hypothetical protein